MEGRTERPWKFYAARALAIFIYLFLFGHMIDGKLIPALIVMCWTLAWCYKHWNDSNGKQQH